MAKPSRPAEVSSNGNDEMIGARAAGYSGSGLWDSMHARKTPTNLTPIRETPITSLRATSLQRTVLA